jgi:uncharacterized damage-inducible protein DinB
VSVEEKQRYPEGRFRPVPALSVEERSVRISELGVAAEHLRQALSRLDFEDLDSPYREGGWTVRQVVHHLADSTANGYQRIRCALTEDCPTIKAYDQGAWSELSDASTGPIEPSLAVYEGLLQRLAALLHSLPAEEFQRETVYEGVGTVTVDWLLQLYAWHCRHHVAHVDLAGAEP